MRRSAPFYQGKLTERVMERNRSESGKGKDEGVRCCVRYDQLFATGVLYSFSNAVTAVVPAVVGITIRTVSGNRGVPGEAAGSGSGIIIAMADTQLRTVDDLHRFLTDWTVGRPARITARRGRMRIKFTVSPGEAAP